MLYSRSRNRARTDIYAEMLQVAASAERKTRIMYQVNLNHQVVDEYLRTLISAGLMERTLEGGTVVYKTTPKGMDFLTDFRTVKAYLPQ